MNDTTILMLIGVGVVLILGLTFLRLWYTMWISKSLHNDLSAIKMQIGKVRKMNQSGIDVKTDLQGMDIKQLASLFGIDSEILDNPIVQGFLEGVMKPKDEDTIINR